MELVLECLCRWPVPRVVGFLASGSEPLVFAAQAAELFMRSESAAVPRGSHPLAEEVARGAFKSR